MGNTKTPQPLVRPYRYKPDIQPAAKDINTYVRPQEVYITPPSGTTSLDSLAAALKENSPILMRYFKTKQNKANEAMAAEGERLQKESQIKDWNEYVKKHPESEKYNPYLREGFEKQAALAKGADYQLWLQNKLATDETLASMTDQTQIDDYIDKLSADYMKANTAGLSDRAVAGFFIPIANAARDKYATDFGRKKLDTLLNEKYDAYEELTVKSADAFLVGNQKQISSSEESADAFAGQLAAQISANAAQTIIDVSNPKRVNDATMEAALTWYQSLAAEHKAFGAKVIEKLTGKDNQKLVGITRYQEAFQKVKKDAWNEQVQKDKDLYWYEQRDKQDRVDAAFAKYGQSIADHPTANHTGLVAQTYKEFGSDAADAIQNWSKACLSNSSAQLSFARSLQSGSGSGGGSVDPIAKYLFLSAANEGTLTDAQIADGVRNKLITPAQAIALKKNMNSGKLSPAAEYGMEVCSAAYGLNKKEELYTTEGMKKVYALQNQFRGEQIRFNLDYQSKNGRMPSTEEAQQHFMKFTDTILKQKEVEDKQMIARNEVSKIASKSSWGLTGQSAIKLTGIQLQTLLDDYNSKGASSSLVKLKSNASPKYRNMPMEQFVHTLADTNGLKLSDNTPPPDYISKETATPPPSSTTTTKKKRGHKM